MKHELTEKQARIIFHDDLSEEDPYQQVEVTEWRDEGKYSWCEVIFSFEGRNYRFSVQRSGSYFTDYHFEFWDCKSCPEVKKVERTIYKWVNA